MSWYSGLALVISVLSLVVAVAALVSVHHYARHVNRLLTTQQRGTTR